MQAQQPQPPSSQPQPALGLLCKSTIGAVTAINRFRHVFDITEVRPKQFPYASPGGSERNAHNFRLQRNARGLRLNSTFRPDKIRSTCSIEDANALVTCNPSQLGAPLLNPDPTRRDKTRSRRCEFITIRASPRQPHYWCWSPRVPPRRLPLLVLGGATTTSSPKGKPAPRLPVGAETSF